MRVSRAHWIKVKLIAKDNRLVLGILLAWFLLGFTVYRFAFGFTLWEAFRASLFLKQVESDFTTAYDMWTQGIIFGVTFSLLFQNILEKYNPERSCRMLARELQDHIVVIGYSHLGRRLVNYFRQKQIPYCVIEKDSDKLDDLLRAGEPVVVDDAREGDALVDANVPAAKAVIVASNNLETALLVTKRARDANKDCRVVTRCYQDEFVEIIESLGADEVISSSKNAFEDIVTKMNV
jgi:D-arabinose 1-dehydrogenase-like Zn-dependent alcohol dehydrogenase